MGSVSKSNVEVEPNEPLIHRKLSMHKLLLDQYMKSNNGFIDFRKFSEVSLKK